MNPKTVGLKSAGAAILLITIGVCAGNRARAQQQPAPALPDLTGQWSGAATILDQSAGIVINIVQGKNTQGENTARGNCIINGFPALFTVVFSQQLSGTWSVASKNSRPFSGTLSSKGALQLTINAATNKHPNCAINVTAKMSGDGTKFAGIFKSSEGCNEQGQGIFQLVSQG